MRIIDTIKSAYLGATGKVQTFEVVENAIKTDKKGKSYGQVPNARQVYRSREDIATLVSAITNAESTNFDRSDLHKIYRDVVLEDSHVVSQWNSRKMKTLKKPFGFFVDNEKQDDLSEVLNKPWFYDFMSKALDYRAWGFSLIELYNWDAESMEFMPYRGAEGRIYDAVQVINRDYVKPELGIVTKEPSDIEGLDILKANKSLIMVGDRERGFLFQLAKLCLFKQNSIANWSEWIEVFGLDTILFFSDAEGAEKQQLINSVKALGTNRMGVFDSDDKAETFGSQKTDAYKVFDEMNKYVDSSISKIIQGQDVVSNNTGQVVGNVGENVANDYAASDARILTYVVNTKIVPLLRNLGIAIPENAKFRFDEQTSLRELQERVEIDLKISQMGFKHDVDMINERYGVEVETMQTASLEQVQNKLKNLYPKS